VDVIKIAIRALLDHGYGEDAIRAMTGGNAGELLLG
jgi:hypothetical protein